MVGNAVNRSRHAEFGAILSNDRVNYAVVDSSLDLDPDNNKITLQLQIDETICSMYEYFDIFLGRMQICRHAAEMLGARFSLKVNGNKVL